ncbi:hydrogenase maturation nickel metallochaperone HypA/HybF [Natronobacterium gregoryi]|uniref:Hydrogenase maturation factor HypA n=2 Tax=Natronobacterium gregoryi TaxID=44930 RepID=L0AJV9_NATGS|nr:hydrogenase maturation nickel metallochaperone HypA [Natronobacterium gregoryi]AFZ73345.1 Zn finger protein HypA/HybF (possibly regulating hydrogenase expression) [Natronobacterium gregoryi SP2]PLK18787.1 hydrogenase expression protein [Natronobacterium gregoryi SP2]SFJ63891.1 hydrogenase nickel incorporation protein HypA/HybF [Natronobacterium gregoryi]
MHELSIASRLVDRALSAADEHDADDVEALAIDVGRAAHVNPDQLQFCLETAVDETIAADATIDIETVSPRARCDCGWDGEPDRLEETIAYAPDVRCPDCGKRAELVAGRECRLRSIEIPDANATEASS